MCANFWELNGLRVDAGVDEERDCVAGKMGAGERRLPVVIYAHARGAFASCNASNFRVPTHGPYKTRGFLRSASGAAHATNLACEAR